MTEYERRECRFCNEGKVYDSTEADKVNVGPYAGRCSHCRGRGSTEHLVQAPEILAAQAAERERVRAGYGQVGDPNDTVYDWMFN